MPNIQVESNYKIRTCSKQKQIEGKVLEAERTLNVISVHHSELELQLQAFIANTHNRTLISVVYS